MFQIVGSSSQSSTGSTLIERVAKGIQNVKKFFTKSDTPKPPNREKDIEDLVQEQPTTVSNCSESNDPSADESAAKSAEDGARKTAKQLPKLIPEGDMAEKEAKASKHPKCAKKKLIKNNSIIVVKQSQSIK
uniref:Uncharacterized protein n=1 Tax=Panagrolaimus sp. ES5 TaxID=591445 RepID=A0AC34FN87_9BILA